MAVTACPSCGGKCEVPEELVAQRVQCPLCGRPFRLGDNGARPAPDSAVAEAEYVQDGGGERRGRGSRRAVNSARDDEEEESYPRERRARLKYCHECGAKIRARAVVCPECGVEQPALGGASRAANSNRVGAGVCAILIGGLGIHKFILGFTGAGITMLLVTIFGTALGLCLFFPILGAAAMHLIGFIEGIIYLTKSDEQFYRDYVVNKRSWF